MKRYAENTWFGSEELINVYYDAHNVESEHTHEFVELVFVINGTVIHRIDNEFYNLKRGSMIFIDIGQAHSFFSMGTVEFVNVFVREDFFKNRKDGASDFFGYLKKLGFNSDEFGLKQCAHFEEKEVNKIEALIDMMNDECINKRRNGAEVISGLFKSLTLLLIRKMSEQQISPVEVDIRGFIDLRSFDNVNINDIAKFFGYNPSYLSRKFKEENGQTIIGYIRKNRAMATTILLETTDYTIENIANIIGYSDVKQIYKLTKKYCGMTPNEIRNKKQIENRGVTI